MEQNYWRKCVVCKNEINFSTTYFKCSVSSCDKKRSPAQFCSVDCWDIHRSIMSHKSAGADEYTSPSLAKWKEQQASESKVRLVRKAGNSSSQPEKTFAGSGVANTEDILIVASKLKAYVKAKSGLNTSADVMPELSDLVRELCDKAIQNSHRDGRKTLMARDFN